MLINSYATEKNTFEIWQDDSAESPREWDNLGKMICFHNRYELGDETEYTSSEFDSWQKLEKYLYMNEEACIILPLYLYDHSGISINTTGFNCQWDSGQIGFIYISKDRIREEYSIKRISRKMKNNITKILNNEVEAYNDYLNGNVYGYTIKDSENNHIIDSCGGFYGYDQIINTLQDTDPELALLINHELV